MKKYISCAFVFLLTLFTNLSAYDTAVFETMLQVDCELERLEYSATIDGHKPNYKKFKHDKRGDGKGTFHHIALENGTSLNWSGYVAATNLQHPANKSVTNVYGSWTVPTVLSSSAHTYSSFWVGIDGYRSGTVEQIGTEHDWVNGKQLNYAWFEMYPQGAYELVGFPVNRGDVMAGQVKYMGQDVFQLIIINYTKNTYAVIPSSYTKNKNALRSSAEWIVEAPSSSQGVLPLANFQTGFLTNCSATINGITGGMNNHHWMYDSLTMTSQNGSPIKAVPSNLTNGTSFNVTWKHN